MFYKNLSNLFNKIPSYYVFFFILLTLILFIEIFNFNENLLIGGLFSIGTFTTIIYVRSSFAKQALENIYIIRQNLNLRQNLIYRYRFYFSKINFFYLIYSIEIRSNLIFMFIFSNSYKNIKNSLKKIKYWNIYNKLFFSNYFNLYYIFEKNIILFLWINSIKIV